jgi:RimJ/RimL family protein N-acetyltransferase
MWVLERTLGASSEMEYLNGPESLERIRRRHERFLAMSADRHAGCMYTIMVGTSAAGSVGYWETDWEGERVWETGWFVLPELQGQGVATQAMRLMIQIVSGLSGYKYIVAFPSTDNGPSNAIARKLGFELVKEIDSEYPPDSGKLLHNNVWRLDLRSTRALSANT